ncbi:MAG TPA: DHA2 family efflux MFS transporter permease subunit [Tepidisphaeraceae bacterium]|jgi:DHA2 family multidrug resistance protein
MSHPSAQPGSNVDVNPWLIALTVSMATFMEVMDTSIANVALRHIAGDLAAGVSESTWVLTSYLVSNAIILPISGWLASVMGRKRFYMSCVALFTVSSFLCGIAPSLGWLLFFRILQGAGGGGLAPSEQAILTDTFPEKKRGQAFALYGMAVVVAPAIGPALGGWITDTYTWRWIFFINIPVGIVSLILTSMVVRDSDAAKEEHKAVWKGGIKVDYLGFALVALGLGCMQVVLDKGQEDDWFGSTFICTMVAIAVVGIVGLLIWEFITDHPIVNLPLFKNPNFLVVNLMMFAVFFVLLATTQLLPQFVQQIMNYDATKAGLILMPGGFVIMALMPVIGRAVNVVQPRYLIGIGLLGMSAAMWYMTNIDTQVSFGVLAMARCFQTASMAFLFVPINTIAYVGLPKGATNDASAMINLMRNLGGSVGISVVTTVISRRSQMHQNRLVTYLTPYDAPYRAALKQATHTLVRGGTPPGVAMHQALASIYASMQAQASMLSYIDAFKLMAIASLIMVGAIFMLKKMRPGEAAHAA